MRLMVLEVEHCMSYLKVLNVGHKGSCGVLELTSVSLLRLYWVET